MKQADELTANEAAALLGYKSANSVMGLWRAERLAGREEPVGIFGRRRVYFKREDVERLAREATGGPTLR
jgi:hypothetical protein